MKTFCGNCGREINGNVKFCSACGQNKDVRKTTPKKKRARYLLIGLSILIAAAVANSLYRSDYSSTKNFIYKYYGIDAASKDAKKSTP